MYREEDYILLSGIQHFAFCRRQWALIHIEQSWSENDRTIEGKFEHEVCHDIEKKESRGLLKISRAMPICSPSLGISGECDVVEFRNNKDGIYIPAYKGYYSIYPIEYKHGEPKEGDEDILQLTAQVMCLEEMFSVNIPYGALFYFKIHRRVEYEITEEMKEKVRNMTKEMHEYLQRGYTPKVKINKKCNACSLREACMPKLMKSVSAIAYMRQALEGEVE